MDNPVNILISKSEVENILNYFCNVGDDDAFLHVNNLEYFQRAFVHESYYQSVQNMILNECGDKSYFMHYIPVESNERLEYLGDHILKAVMGKYLFERFPKEREGFLTKLKIKIEKCSMLHRFGVQLGFKKFLLLSLQVENQTILDVERGRNTPSYYEDVFEAFIGSIIMDFGEKGYIYAERFVRSVIENVIDFSDLVSNNDNFKDSLQRYYQSLKILTPKYTPLEEYNPLYRKVFVRMLTISGDVLDQLDDSVKEKVKHYSKSVISQYKQSNKAVFLSLLQIQNEDKYVLGIGSGRKVVEAEQYCAKQCLLNLNISINY